MWKHVYLIVHLQIVKMVDFMLCVSYHNLKNSYT